MENFICKSWVIIIMTAGLIALLGIVLNWNKKLIKAIITIAIICTIILIDILIIIS